MLPIDAHGEAILGGLSRHGRLIIVAPPGTGKSTRVPPMLAAGSGKVVVLQPRRIAARNLAYRVAEEMGVELGGEVGYQVRYEGKATAATRILFQTYGVFFQRLLESPRLEGVDAVVFDEFHERALECDASLAYCLRLQASKRPDLKIIVMSATLESPALSVFLAPAALIEVDSPMYPVEISHQGQGQNESPWDQATRALRRLSAQGLTGSVLVFMPGVGEIRRTCEALDPLARALGFKIHELHGGMDLEAQQRALRGPQAGPCIVVATNVAETSLTIPGITAVIDSGLQRVASFNPERDMDTLYLKSISLHSATQRAGRAGRTAPGACIRLWSAERERAMAVSLDPEVRRVDLTGLALKLHSLDPAGMKAASFAWLDAPSPSLWAHALENLRRIDALDDKGITPQGQALLRWSVHPVPGRALLAARDGGKPLVFAVAAAMAAILESDASRNPRATSDLFVLGRDLARDPQDRQVERDVRETWLRLLRLGKCEGLGDIAAAAENAGPELREEVSLCFLSAFVHRLAVRQDQGQSFALADGRRGTVDSKQIAKDFHLLLALEMRETGGAGKSRQINIPLLLPILPDWIAKLWPEETAWVTEKTWDDVRGGHLTESRQIFRGLILQRKVVEGAAKGEAAEILVDKLIAGEITLPGFDEEAWQIVHRIRLAAATFPDMGFPKLDEEDWRLIYHDLCEGKSSLRQLEGVSVAAALRDYLGYSLWQWLEREAPTSFSLPGGKRAKITYPEKGPPEMSARLGDFAGLEGKTAILQKRIVVTYDILAPNYRTVQKTQDISSFWKNTYPEVKKELKRRYPRHPWP